MKEGENERTREGSVPGEESQHTSMSFLSLGAHDSGMCGRSFFLLTRLTTTAAFTDFHCGGERKRKREKWSMNEGEQNSVCECVWHSVCMCGLVSVCVQSVSEREREEIARVFRK